LRPVPWSIENQTALADAELEYQDITDKSVYVLFELTDAAALPAGLNAGNGAPIFLMIWTTTPWTLPANLAVAVNADLEYGVYDITVAGKKASAILAKGRAGAVLRDQVSEARGVCTGRDLLGVNYRHPFADRVGRVVLADYVTLDAGTGLVHTAPGHGEDDYETGMREKLTVYSPVLANGRFDETVPEWIRGKKVWEANAIITAHLNQTGHLFFEESYTHSYPHDWRSKTKIIFRATEQWFVAVDKAFVAGEGQEQEPRTLRARAAKACSDIVKFVPEWGQHRIGGMVQSRPDWCISRQRAWGLPIPVFYNEQGAALLTPESVRAVARRFAEKGSDAWFTDSPAELLGKDFHYPPEFSAEGLRKEKDIFDVWFESGSSWRAVLQERTELHFPADLYLEGSDQHRGWFQLSLLLSLGATGIPPFKQIVTNGFIVKPDGTKVSKSDKEYVKAVDEINRHGADLLRLWCCSVDYQNDIPTSPKVIAEFADKYRKIRNTLRYLLSNLYDFDVTKNAAEVSSHSLDGWALAEVDQLIIDVTAAYEAYQLHRAFRLLYDFCSVQISAVYGNAMKDRLYCDPANSPARRRCQTVMQKISVVLCKLLSPMIVYTADEAWEHVTHKPAAEEKSVHLALLPKASGVVVSAEQREEWKVIMELRDAALGQLDKLKKEAGLNKALDAEVIYHVGDDQLRSRLLKYGDDLEDLVGAGFHSFAGVSQSQMTVSGAVQVEVVDRRQTYPACARSWKRRPDVGRDAEFPDLSARDAAVMRTSTT
jgi:isoleucyl-tRNA synthetase